MKKAAAIFALMFVAIAAAKADLVQEPETPGWLGGPRVLGIPLHILLVALFALSAILLISRSRRKK